MKNKEQTKISIIDTLSYFDVFNYSPTLLQIEHFLHFNNEKKKDLEDAINEIYLVDQKYGYYFFRGKEKNAIKRKIQEEENKKKLKEAKKYIFLISKIPGVKLIALTGSLAMQNASKKDDIDLFIITRKNSLWITRLLVVIAAKIFGKKRSYKSKDNGNKLCLNMFLDERELEFADRNLYAAHEIAQMKVLFGGENIVREFAQKNLWVKDFLPNVKVKKRDLKNENTNNSSVSEKILRVFNFSVFLAQYAYMSKKITKEKITLRKALFHPNDNTLDILQEHKKRKATYTDIYKNKNYLQNREMTNKDYKKSKLYN